MYLGEVPKQAGEVELVIVGYTGLEPGELISSVVPTAAGVSVSHELVGNTCRALVSGGEVNVDGSVTLTATTSIGRVFIDRFSVIIVGESDA